ncbi:hypothetical protein BDQ12DRAFT_729391 [Crucibulum laeve]|uniref:Uncharacterized protein n=1 Tax=Crucibulum laeve TaxID=68775 RepID=A0A5C3LFU0_9AGAR|nr:hypothetical protein BDQ12DRAFT_729391 [Crucibulum laeve]
MVEGAIQAAESANMGHINLALTESDASYSSLYLYSASILFEMLLYGIYIALFVVCMRVLVVNRKSTQKFMLTCAIAMFLLATVDIALAVCYLYWFVLKNVEIPDDNVHFKYLIYITSNCIADILVIYRCYTIWNNSKRVIIVPSIMLLAGSACGYTFIGLSEQEYRFRDLLRAFLFITLALNVLVTVLMAGRIWWISKKARAILGPGLAGKYNTAIAIIVESGIIYAIYVTVDVVFQLYPLDAGLAQVVGIVPTLMIVQVGLGRNTKDIDTTVSRLRTDTRGMTTCEPQFDTPPSIPETTQISTSPIDVHRLPYQGAERPPYREDEHQPPYREDDMCSDFEPPTPMTPTPAYSRTVNIDLEPRRSGESTVDSRHIARSGS